MWNNYSFVSELLGTLVLALGVSGILLATRLKAFGLKGTSAHIFTAMGIALSLFAAVMVAGMAPAAAWIGKTHGFANPAVALMHAIGNNNFNFILPSVAGEILGAMVGVMLVCVASKLVGEPKVVEIEAKYNVKNSIVGEVLGSALFIGGVAVAVFYNNYAGNVGIAALVVSVSIAAAILGFGHKFALSLNPAMAIAMFISDTVASKGKNWKFNLANNSISMATNLVVSAAIGGVAYGLIAM